MLKDIQCKEETMAKRYLLCFVIPFYILDLKSTKSCYLQHVQLFQVCHQSQTHHPSRLCRIHGWDSEDGGSTTQLPEAAADWSQGGTECDIRPLHAVPVSSQRSRKVGWSSWGHPHSVGESCSTHADQALRWAPMQAIICVASDDLSCCDGLSCLH